MKTLVLLVARALCPFNANKAAQMYKFCANDHYIARQYTLWKMRRFLLDKCARNAYNWHLKVNTFNRRLTYQFIACTATGGTTEYSNNREYIKGDFGKYSKDKATLEVKDYFTCHVDGKMFRVYSGKAYRTRDKKTVYVILNVEEI